MPPNLPIGPYWVEVGKQGFTTDVQTGIVLASCCFPEVALAKPGSSNTTHESLAISLKLIETSGLSVFTRISVPARTVL